MQGWVTWRDASGNLVMVEKQRTSGPGAQFGRNEASAFGAQNANDEDDFVTITGALSGACLWSFGTQT